jgi:hypothetical protein
VVNSLGHILTAVAEAKNGLLPLIARGLRAFALISERSSNWVKGLTDGLLDAVNAAYGKG